MSCFYEQINGDGDTRLPYRISVRFLLKLRYRTYSTLKPGYGSVSVVYEATDTVPYSSGFRLKIRYRICSVFNKHGVRFRSAI